MSLIKVTMNLSEFDKENASRLKEMMKLRSSAHAVSLGLALTRFVADAMTVPGTDLMIRRADGSFERIVVPELLSMQSNLNVGQEQDASVSAAE